MTRETSARKKQNSQTKMSSHHLTFLSQVKCQNGNGDEIQTCWIYLDTKEQAAARKHKGKKWVQIVQYKGQK